MTDVALTLGIMTFSNFEVPQNINFGGEQNLSVKTLVGGQRVIDAMGRMDDDISWSGLFFGENATERAQFLDAQRVLGIELPLTYFTFNYLVIIKDFKCSFERFYQIRYSITVTVVQNLTLPFTFLLPSGYNDAINNDLNTSNNLSVPIANPVIIADLIVVSASIKSVPSLVKASPSTIAAILKNIGTLQVDIASAIANLELFLSNNPNLPNDQLSVYLEQLNLLYQLNFVVNRMSDNLMLIDSGADGTILTINGANLFQLAAQYYGDATQWTTIARANNLDDPEILPGNIMTLIIPKNPNASTCGVLSN